MTARSGDAPFGRPSRRVKHGVAFTVASLVAGLTAASTGVEPAAAQVDPVCPGTLVEWTNQPLTVCGSVEQIFVANAVAGAHVDIAGPESFSAVADAGGGLVVRDVSPGVGYTVTVGDEFGVTPGTDPSSVVDVIAPDAHPVQSFYDLQTLSTSAGYFMTRDQTWLSYDVELPAQGCDALNPCDVVIVYSGYTPGLDPDLPGVGPRPAFEDVMFDRFSALGYAVVGVNMRGSSCSGGAFDLMEELVALDGYDMVEVLSAQDWIEDIAMVDRSWPGLSQLSVASTQPPSLDAIVPGAVVADFYRDFVHPGGLTNILGEEWASNRDSQATYPSSNPRVNAAATPGSACLANQALRGQNTNTLATMDAHPYDDEYWHERAAAVDDITIPTLLVASWQDNLTGGRPAALLDEFAPTTPARLIATNGGHDAYTVGEIWDEVVEFVDVYLGDGQGIAAYEAQDPVEVLLETTANGVPRARFTMASYTEAGDGDRFVLGTDLVAEDPDTPAELSSTFTYTPILSPWETVVQDQGSFQSAPLPSDLVMAGSGSVDLWIESTADVDLRVTLSEVRSDGQEQFVQRGYLRSSARALDTQKSTPLRPWQLHQSGTPLVPGVTTEMRVELFPFAHAFRAGSRIRLIVDAPNTSAGAFAWGFDALPGGHDVTIAHDPVNVSSVVLPVIDAPAWEQPLPPSLAVCADVWVQPCRIVGEVNVAPVLDSVGSHAVDELVELAFGATATDGNLPGDLLTFSLDGGVGGSVPAGASISTGGAFSWTPTEAQGPGVYVFDVVVTDAGVPALEERETITVTVGEVNDAPVLDPVGPKAAGAPAALVFTATAADGDLPANAMTFSLDDGAGGSVPAGAVITPGGVFTWTPDETQGPGVYVFDVVVTDDGVPGLADSETITVTIDELNVAPVLDPLGAQAVDELAELTFTASATDANLPGDTLIFLLDAGAGGSVPPGAALSTEGAFSWTPTEAQGPGTYVFDVVVSDDGIPVLGDRETVTVTVDEVNLAPVLDPVGNQSAEEHVVLAFTATAVDVDLPANGLTFSLDDGPGSVPSGAVISPGGAFSWTPGEEHGAGVFTFDVVVSDDGPGSLEHRETITVTVDESNSAPVLDPIGDLTVEDQGPVTFGATAVDTDVPVDSLTFSLEDGATGSVPDGASIGAGGAFSWTPTEAQGGVHTFDVVVSDNGTPNLEDRETITLTVHARFDDFGEALILSGASGSVAASSIWATEEVGEPTTGCGAAVAPVESVWFAWTAPATERVQFDTIGSDFDTYLHVYTGASVGSLNELACNDVVPAAGHDQAAVFFDATIGTTYRIRVDGAGGAAGDIALNWGASPVLSVGVVVATSEGDLGSTFWNLPVTLSTGSTVPVTIDWATDNTPSGPFDAEPGLDFVADSGTVTFLPGETSKMVAIEILGDTLDEPPFVYGEWGFVPFSNETFAQLEGGGLPTLGIFIIVDDDPKVITPRISGSAEGDTGSVVVDVPVTLSHPSDTPVTIDWQTLDTGSPGIATADVDYLAGSGTVTFAPGETSQTYPITVLGDTLDEPVGYLGEWILVLFSNPSPNATLDIQTFFGIGVHIIFDDD